jgi:hypothetical protein
MGSSRDTPLHDDDAASAGITPINLYGTAYLPLTAARDHSESPPTTGHKTAFMQVIAVIRSQS